MRIWSRNTLTNVPLTSFVMLWHLAGTRDAPSIRALTKSPQGYERFQCDGRARGPALDRNVLSWWSRTDPEDERQAYLMYAAPRCFMETLVRGAGTRGCIESGFAAVRHLLWQLWLRIVPATDQCCPGEVQAWKCQ